MFKKLTLHLPKHPGPVMLHHKIVLGGFALSMAHLARAAVDVTGVVDALATDAGGAVTSIGTAILGVAVIAASFKWAKAALFG